MSNAPQNLVVVDAPKVESQFLPAIRAAGLELESAGSLLSAFTPLLEQAEEWRKKVELIHVTDVSQVREMEMARASRLALKDIRVSAEKTRKKLKEDSLRRGKAIDGVYNVIEFIIAPLEKSLLEQEQFAERKETERKAALKQEREALLRPYGTDTQFFSLGDMPQENFDTLYNGTKAAFEAAQTALLKAEQDRIARDVAIRAEQEKVRIENERLKKEAAEREEENRRERLRLQALADVERQKAQILKDTADKERAAARAAQEAEEKRRHAAEKQAADAEARRIAEKKRHEEIEAGTLREKTRLEKERVAKILEQERIDAARESAPDREKLSEFAASVREVRCPIMSDGNKQTENAVNASLDDFACYLSNLATQF